MLIFLSDVRQYIRTWFNTPGKLCSLFVHEHDLNLLSEDTYISERSRATRTRYHWADTFSQR